MMLWEKHKYEYNNATAFYFIFIQHDHTHKIADGKQSTESFDTLFVYL